MITPGLSVQGMWARALGIDLWGGGSKQDAGGRRQEAGGRRQEAGGRKQEAGSSKLCHNS